MIFKDCVLLIGSCDAYQDILDPFFTLLKKYWPDLPFNIVLSTESLEYKNQYFNIKNIHPKEKNCSWTERITETLKQIEENYVMLMLDDFFLYDYVNTNKIENTLKILKENSKIATITYWPIYCISQNVKYNELLKRKNGEKNKVAAIAGIWNKKKLLAYTRNVKETAWQWEQNATERSNTLFKNDDFYVLKCSQEKYIPYDFSKYGLFCGKWMKATEELFKKEKIEFDFSKRGFYDEALKGLEKSVSSIFKIESAIIPYYALEHKGSSYQKYKKENESEKVMHQEYKIKNARNIIRWEPAFLIGFGIENLKITVVYRDQTIETIDNENLFGSFFREKNVLIFNTPGPYVFIPTIENKLISKLKIEANVIHPLEEKILRKSYLKETAPKEKYKHLIEKHHWEFLVSKEKIGFSRLNSVIKSIANNKEEIVQEFTEEINNKKFIITIPVKDNWDKIVWFPNDSNIGYELKNLHIYKIDKKGTKMKLNQEITTNYLKEKNNYYCLSILPIEINIKDAKKIIIKGKFVCPINRKFLKGYLEKI